MKTAIITDSNAGITQERAKELGLFIVPMPFTINNEEFFEDINLTQEEFYKKLEDKSVEILTAQPSIGDLTDLWNKVLEDYDEIVYIPMSSGLSGSCQTATMLSQEEEFEGKVFVVDSQRISVTQMCDALDALKLSQQGKTGQEIYDILMENKMNATIYITIPTLEYLLRGGRVTPAVATLGSLLKLKPVLTIQGDKLDSCDVARTMKKAQKIMLEHVLNDIKERNLGAVRLFSVYSKDEQPAIDYVKEINQVFPDVEVEVYPLSLSISCHIGPGALALAAAKKIV